MTPKEMYQKIDELKAQLAKLQPLKPEDEQRLWKKFRLEWNYNSNHMEGNTLTYGHTELLLIFGKTTGDYDKREQDEMVAHDVAIKMVVELAQDKERDLTENFIRQLNEIILVRPFWKEAITPDGQPTRREITPGEYKKFPNSVRLENGEIFHYASPEETPALMNDLMQFYKTNAASTEVHPLWLAAMLHYKFVRIHPFDDGNGRVARLLTNYVLMKNNFPPVVIKDTDKKNYITALNKADAGDLESFVFYICEQLLWSIQLSINAAKGKDIDEPGDIDKEIAVLKMELKNKNALTQKATSDIICNTVAQNIFPLFIMMEEKSEGLKEFFFDTNRRMEVETEKVSGARLVASNKSKWELLNQNWLQSQVRGQKQKLKQIKYTYEFKGFKKNVSATSFWLAVDIFFNDYNYIIQTNKNRNQPEPIPYGKIFTNGDLLMIVTPLIKEIIEDIKRLTRNN